MLFGIDDLEMYMKVNWWKNYDYKKLWL